MLLKRRVADIYIPPVNVTSDHLQLDQLFELHCAQKLLFQDLVRGGVDHEEVLEALEVFIETPNMDNYIRQTEQKLDWLLDDL